MRLANDSPSFTPVHSRIRAIEPRNLHLAKGRGLSFRGRTSKDDIGHGPASPNSVWPWALDLAVGVSDARACRALLVRFLKPGVAGLSALGVLDGHAFLQIGFCQKMLDAAVLLLQGHELPIPLW